MSGLIDKINQDLVAAQKARDETVVSTLRFLLANIKNAQIAKGEELSEPEIIEQIQKDVKRHRESIEAFEGGNRSDLVEKEKMQLEVLGKYLPAQLSRGEIAKIVDEVILQVGAKGSADMGGVMGQVMARVRTQADGAAVSQIVKEKLFPS